MADQNTLPFLPFSNPRVQDLGTQNYAVNGGRLTFTSLPGNMGMADGAFITLRGTATPTLGGGAARWSGMRSFFPTVSISQGGKTYRENHPAYYVARALTERRQYLLNAQQNAGGDSFGAPYHSARLGGTLPALTGAAALPFVYTFFVPFRWRRNLQIGMFPVGDSTRPLVIDLQLPSAAHGNDPQNFPILTSGAATVALSATVEVALVYREVLAYMPGALIEHPAVGTQVRVSQQTVPITGVGAEFTVQHTNQFPHVSLFTFVQDGNANPAAAAGVNGEGLTTLGVSRFRYTLTSQAPVLDLDSAIKRDAWLMAQRYQYGLDLPDGWYPLKFGEDDHGLGYWNFPTDDVIGQLPNLATWSNSMTGVTLSGAINSAGAGLARILSIAEWLEPVSY